MELAAPSTQTFDTPEECIHYAQSFASTQGYAITTRRSKYIHHDEQKVLDVAYLHCCKSGTYQNRGSENKEKKESASRLTDCPFRASIRR